MTGVGLAQPIRIPLNKVKPMSGPKMMMAGMMRVPDRIDVVDGIEGNAALQARGLVAQPRSHPGMGTLMHAKRKDEQNKLEHSDREFGRLHQTLPGFGKAQVSRCTVPSFHREF